MGAVIVRERRRPQVVATGYNRPITDHDPTAHAEIVALRHAAHAARELPPARVRAVRHARALRDVRDGADARALQARGVRRAPTRRPARPARWSTCSPTAAQPPHRGRRRRAGRRSAAQVLREFFAERREQYRQRRAAPAAAERPTPTPIPAGEVDRDRRRPAPSHERPMTDAARCSRPPACCARRRRCGCAAERLTALGFEVAIDASVRCAGTSVSPATTRRAWPRCTASPTPAPSIAMATRGGYGLTRLLDRIDWKRIARSVERGTRWVGHSDLTALQLGLLAHAGGASPGPGRWPATTSAAADEPKAASTTSRATASSRR